jgi:N-acetyl-gamma-glutamyl-phosphate reductase
VQHCLVGSEMCIRDSSVAIDNLGKGAAAQAIQNANLMCGLDEEAGLSFDGLGV